MGTQSEQIEREVHQVRAQLSETLEELRARMTPGQIVDQLADYARGGPAAEFLRNLAREVRENPLPLTLIAVGVAWVIIASSRSFRAGTECSAAREAAYERARKDDVLSRATIGEPEPHPEYPGEIVTSMAPHSDEEVGWQHAHAMEQAHEQH